MVSLEACWDVSIKRCWPPALTHMCVFFHYMANDPFKCITWVLWKKKKREKPISSVPLEPVLISSRCEGPRPLSSRVTQTCFFFSQVVAGQPQQERKIQRGRERRSRQVGEESACSPTPSRGKALMIRRLTWVSSLTTTRPLLLGKSSVRPLQVEPEY